MFKARKITTTTALAGSALIVAAALSTPAFALPIFTVQEGSIPGTTPHIVVADDINGNYTEKFTVTGPTSFTTNAVFDAGNFVLNFSAPGATNVSSFLNSPEPIGYKLYALFTSSGTIATSGGATTFTSTSGSVRLFADPLSDTTKTFGATGADPIALGLNGDDFLLATANTLQQGEGHLFSSLANGDFELVFNDFGLTTAGKAYFIAPNPFYLVLDINGNFQNFPVSGTQTIGGSANAFFAVPEPGTLALGGLALVGLALSRRRKAS